MNNRRDYEWSLGLSFEFDNWDPHVSFASYRCYSYDDYMKSPIVTPPAPHDFSYEHTFVPPSPYEVPSTLHHVGCQSQYVDAPYVSLDPTLPCFSPPLDPTIIDTSSQLKQLEELNRQMAELSNQMLATQHRMNSEGLQTQVQPDLVESPSAHEYEPPLAQSFDGTLEECHNLGHEVVDPQCTEFGVDLGEDFEPYETPVSYSQIPFPPPLPILSSPTCDLDPPCDTLGFSGETLSWDPIMSGCFFEPFEASSCEEEEHLATPLGVETLVSPPYVPFFRKPDLIPSSPLSCFPLVLRPLDFDSPPHHEACDDSLVMCESIPPCVFSPFSFYVYTPSRSFRFVYMSLYFMFAFSFFLFILIYSLLFVECVASAFDKLLRSLSTYLLATVKLKTLNKRFSGGNPSY